MLNNAWRRSAALVAAVVLVLGACGGDDGPSGQLVEDGLGCQPNRVDRRADAPEVVPVEEPPEGVATEDLDVGEGCTVDFGSFLGLDLVGATSDGTVFVDTFAGDGGPIVGQLGTGTLLPGLEEGLTDLQVGGRRQITVPAPLAYGEEGNEAQGIGPDETLVFVVDLVSVTTRPVSCSPALVIPEGERDGKPTEVAMPVEIPTELTVTELEPGEGADATEASYVTVDYLGIACSTGQQFDTSWDRDEPFTIAMGAAEPTAAAGSVIPGWTEGLVGATEGSLVQLEIPPALAYGPQGSGAGIGPNETLVFVIRVIEVSDEPPPDPEPEELPEPEDPPEGEDQPEDPDAEP